MRSGLRGGVRAAATASATRPGIAAVAVLATVPGVAAGQTLGPSTVAGTPPAARAAGSFLLVGLLGGAFLSRRERLVDRAVDDTLGRPAVAIVYGFCAYALVAFAGFYTNNLLAQLGVTATPLGALAALVLVGGLALVSAFGLLVVGTLLTGLWGPRRPRRGLALAASASAASWFLLPAGAAFAALVLVAAVGVGGPTRTWVHRSRPVGAQGDG